jgi:glycosyltransferase involved in cell wall biosynthesis
MKTGGRLKIAVWHNLPSGGGKRALYGHVAGLLARGHEVEAWSPECADATYLPLSELIREHRLPFAMPDATQGKLGRFVDKFLVNDALLAEMDRHSRECAEAIARGGFHLVFVAPCVFYRVPRLGRFLAGRGLPLALYLQEPCRWLYEALPELPWLAPVDSPGDGPLRRWKRRAFDAVRIRRLRAAARRELEDAKCYERILVNSFYSRESIARAYGLDARVCYLGYDDARFRRLDPAPQREDFIIGLGSIDYIKGVDTAIRAVGQLPAPRPPLMWVANSGSDSYEREMGALAVAEGVEWQIRRRIDDQTLVGLLNRARLLLYTSRLEPFGYAPIEANACGTPVVAVAEGGVRETVINAVNGLLCDRDPPALATAMSCLLANPTLAGELGANGERMAREKWLLEQSAERLEMHLREVLRAGTRHRAASADCPFACLP